MSLPDASRFRARRPFLFFFGLCLLPGLEYAQTTGQPPAWTGSPRWLSEFDIAPPNAASFEEPLAEPVRNRHVLKLYAPAQLEWTLTGTERDFRFEYGYVPKAYEEGRSNGADILVELSYAGQSRLLFQRHLDPARNADDRKHQASRVVLPPYSPGSRLIFRSAPGEFNDNAWDWVYVCNIRFKQDPQFTAEQFPTFNRVPTAVEAEASYLYQKQGTPSFLQLNAPAQLTYDLRGDEHHLSFRFGFLDGAYSKGGQTDGALFMVEAQSAGAPAQLLFQRLLQPLGQAADRGPQTADLIIPNPHPGIRLVIRIDPGPSRNNSWDWTYISRLRLE